MNKKSEIKFKNLIFIPLFLAFVGFFASAAIFIYRLQQIYIDKDVRTHLQGVQEITQSHLSGIIQSLSGIMELIKEEKEIQNAWLKKDRGALFQHANRIYQFILISQRVTHFYFIDRDSMCFLRIHKPEYFGDPIQRRTFEQSKQNQAPGGGMELGPLGTLTLRLVHPWIINGKMTGYIELGVEIENLAPKLKRILDSDLVFTVNKKFLDRKLWEEGLKMVGRAGDWEQFPDFVVISQTLPAIPFRTNQFQQLRNGSNLFNITHSSVRYSGGFVPLTDAGNNVIGDIIVLKDITKEAGILKSLSTIMVVGGVIGVALFVTFYFFSGRIEKRLISSHRELSGEIIRRKHAQKELHLTHENMETRIAERTAELSRLNAKLQIQISRCEQTQSALRESEKEHQILSGKLLSAEENERKKISRNVHDSIGQALSAIKYSLENSIEKLHHRISEEDLAALQAVVPITQKSIEEVRRIAMDLRPSTLDDLGIIATINWFCREFQTIYTGISIQKNITVREDDISTSLKTTIYRILQEALNNVTKHSQAGIIRISLKKTGQLIELFIADNGIGFDAEQTLELAPSKRGLGLASMKKRAENSNGLFTLDTTPGGGTRICISWRPGEHPEKSTGDNTLLHGKNSQFSRIVKI